MKEQAIKYLEELNIYSAYIRAFKAKSQKVCFFENYGGFYDYQEPWLEAKRKEIEKEYDAICYAITHDFINGDEMYSFLLSTKDGEDIEKIENNIFNCFAYVYNKDYEDGSELGYITVRSFGGGIKRIY